MRNTKGEYNLLSGCYDTDTFYSYNAIVYKFMSILKSLK